MLLYRKNFSFLVQVMDRGHLNTAGGYAEGRVLNSLEFLDKGWLGVRESNWSCMHEKGPDKGFIGDEYGFLLLTPVGTSKALRMSIRGNPRVTTDSTWALNMK